MVRLASHCKLAVLVLSLTLLTPWTAAALPLERSAPEPRAGFVSLFFDWLTSAFGNIGCSMDPGGRCRDTSESKEPPAAGEHLDIGCSWDPNGGACANRG